MSQFIHRLTIIVPANRVTALTTWWVANLDPNGANTFNVPLNASGDPDTTPTHYWCCGAFTDQQIRTLLRRLCQQAQLTEPSDWDTYTRQQKRQWLADNLGTVLARIGVRIQACDNDGVWANPDDAREAHGLKRVVDEGVV